VKPAIERGEKCYNARLTEEQVRLARIYVMQGPVGVLPQLARKWGVGKQTLRNAVIYKNWKHIPPPTAEEIAATPLPSWVETVGRETKRAHCGRCVHWDHTRGCTMGIPESGNGGFFAASCAPLMPLQASRTNQWICDRCDASDSANSSAYSSSPFISPR
jgi:hypothetical protein